MAIVYKPELTHDQITVIRDALREAEKSFRAYAKASASPKMAAMWQQDAEKAIVALHYL